MVVRKRADNHISYATTGKTHELYFFCECGAEWHEKVIVKVMVRPADDYYNSFSSAHPCTICGNGGDETLTTWGFERVAVDDPLDVHLCAKCLRKKASTCDQFDRRDVAPRIRQEPRRSISFQDRQRIKDGVWGFKVADSFLRTDRDLNVKDIDARNSIRGACTALQSLEDLGYDELNEMVRVVCQFMERLLK